MKPHYELDMASDAPSCLEVYKTLRLLSLENCNHNSNNLRLPFGIYNISINRICEKLILLSKKLENYFDKSYLLEHLEEKSTLRQEIVDYIELSLYSAAEHIDDLDSIASGFYKNKNLRDKSNFYKKFQKNIKTNKRFISSFTNSIKHNQSRIRIFSTEFSNGKFSGCLHGYFIEGVKAGAVGPSESFHLTESIYSITTLIWEIILLLLNCSRDLNEFLINTGSQIIGPVNTQFDAFQLAINSAARLPLYTFGEAHPFEHTKFSLLYEDDAILYFQSACFGSLIKGWDRSALTTFGKSKINFESDGVTKTFNIPIPKIINLQHWG